MNSNNTPNHPAQDPVAKAVQDNGNAKLVGAKEVLKEKLLGALLQQAINELGEPASIARNIMASRGDQLGSIVAASRVLRGLIMAEIENRSRQTFADPATVARELFRNVSDEGQVVESITDELRAMILAMASQTAKESVADSESVARELIRSNAIDSGVISNVSGALRNLVLETAATSSRESLSDVDGAAREVIRGMGENPELIVNLGDRVRELILNEVERRASESLADGAAAASQVWDRISSDDSSIRAVADKVHDQLIGEIVSRTQETLSNADDTAQIARDLMGATPEGVVNASRRLEKMLISEIVHSGERALADTQRAIRITLEQIKPSPEDLARIQDGVKSKILQDVLARAIKEINEEVRETAADMWLGDGSTAADRTSTPVDRDADSLGEFIPTDTGISAIESPTVDTRAYDESDAGANEPEWQFGVFESSDESGQSAASSEIEPASPASLLIPSEDDYAGWSGQEGDNNEPIAAASGEEAAWKADDSAEGEYSDEADWYSLEMPAASQPEDGTSAESVENDSASEDERANIKDEPTQMEALGLLASWKRKRGNWKVDEVELDASQDDASEWSSDGHSAGREAADEAGRDSASDNHESWTVAIVRDAARLSVKVSESDRLIEDSLSKISQGVMTFVKDEMHRLDGIGSGQAADLMCEHCIQRTHTALSDRTIESKKRAIEDSPIADADVIFVGAYLVEKNSENVLADEVARLSAEFGDLGFRLVLDGPHSASEFAKDGPSNMERATA